MSDDKVIPLRGTKIFPPEPDAAVVEYLESVLDKARNGEVVGVLVVSQWRDELVSHHIVGHTQLFRFIGAMEEAKYLHLKERDEPSSPGAG